MKFLTAMLFIIFSGNLFAEVAGYEVEIIIFEDKTRHYIKDENWPSLTEDGTIYDNQPAPKNTFTLINNKDFRLNEHKQRLANSPDYKVLYHIAWKQRGLDENDAVPFYINNESKYNDSINSPAEEIKDSIIKGNITLVLSRFLHLKTNLIYMPPKATESASQNKIENSETETTIEPQSTHHTFYINSERRMRSKETHYIDHPLIGIVSLVTPYHLDDTNTESLNLR
ncbi:MAG: peptidoglycan binding protein CsiV [Gammaproteobacteria bacterium]|nr:peptidoglycan binding protein CsiV [Gammaproteobacteria bacterium]